MLESVGGGGVSDGGGFLEVGFREPPAEQADTISKVNADKVLRIRILRKVCI